MKRAFLADEIFDGKDMVPSRALLLDEGRITGIVSPTEIPSAFSRRDFPGCFLAPSFIDIQIYGGNGRLFSHSVDSSSLDATAAYCAAGGCSHFMITMATNAMSCFMQGIEVVREYISSGKKGLLGLHLEGPWISPAKRGAHIEAYIKKGIFNRQWKWFFKYGQWIKVKSNPAYQITEFRFFSSKDEEIKL